MIFLNIHVRRDHIKHGIKCDCLSCPVALAINELFPDHNVEVGHGFIQVLDPHTNESIQKWAWGALSHYHERYKIVPREVHAFIHAFDHGLNVFPFSFTLEI